ncbi:FAD-dependent oxidoreductase [Amycolatopsis rubida]|uniref:FAD-dependent oxidoreductase n=1 Tax=Amycolatopsis rubida TaxID=112413 RepID=A0ABX0BXU3_9PSEU|nr:MULTISPECIES: FAD-dependent oxidoreductase [Amycolatopsis]MYW93960.1 FAD-dependent oxidoreductase [Amycolatopsis rubida]NEC58949.1 FAD-dependent oxidoreductase [Amycolatopsis rubida]OAP20952.1 putative epoxidase LasC [Amycolatopsis sp. M39]
METRNRDRAVVLGGSMAGLLAARVLSESFADVLVLDRDDVGGTAARRGVPQGRHVHGLLARGQQILEELFPGFTREMVGAGVPTGDLGGLRWFFDGRRLSPGETGLTCVSASRPVLEHHVRERVRAIPNVRLERRDVLGLAASPGRGRVTGVRTATGERRATVGADLVVDATGRGSRTPAWLAGLGYERPAEDRISVKLSYTTRHFALSSPDVLQGDLSINPVSTPASPRGAFLSDIGGGRCVVSLTGVLGDSAPVDPAGFLEFARSLPVPDVHDVIRDAEPLDDAVLFRYPASVRRRYERLDRFPEGFLVLGDAACSFNPVYGQGMTVAAQEALALRAHLEAEGPGRPRAFFAGIAKVIDVPWGMSAAGDLGFAGVPGKRTAQVKFLNAYLARLRAAAARDGRLTSTFMRVAGLVDPPSALLSPATALRVLRNGWRAAPAPVAAAPERPDNRLAA